MNRHLKRSAGFSLLELMIALTVLGFAAAAGYAALRSGLDRLDRLHNAAERDGDAAVALALLSKDARAALLNDDPSTLFVGYHDVDTGMDRLQLSLESGPVEYRVKHHGLWRNTPERDVLLCERTDAFRLRFFDGNAWHDQWGWDDERNRPYQGIRGLPVAVQIRLNESTATAPVMTALLNSGR